MCGYSSEVQKLISLSGLEPPPKPKARLHPMVKLQNYIDKHNLKLIDFFQKFDKDGSMSVSHEEFADGIQVRFSFLCFVF